jgi:tRNA A37 threonylcarbamoyladenosine synthetase subunit TsaC/SUA5/YrdC
MTSCKQKELDWTQLTSFKIYDFKTFPQDKDLRTCSDSDIQQMKYIETNLDQAKNVLSKSIPLGETSYLWKGHHFTTATFSDGL